MSNPTDHTDDVQHARQALDRYNRELHGEGDIAIGRALSMCVDLAGVVRGLLAVIDRDRDATALGYETARILIERADIASSARRICDLAERVRLSE